MNNRLSALLEAVLDLRGVRYAAILHQGALRLHERSGLQGASDPESDRYEELLVNPTLLTLVTQRGNIDCGGLRFVIIRYGNFFQIVRSIPEGHLSRRWNSIRTPWGLPRRLIRLWPMPSQIQPDAIIIEHLAIPAPGAKHRGSPAPGNATTGS